MTSIGSLSSYRGNRVEGLIAKKYDGIRRQHAGYDIEFEHLLLEVKSCLEWHISSAHGKKYRHRGRYLINKQNHKTFKKQADARGKGAFYAFVLIPRYDDGRIERNPSEWFEEWLSWEEIDSLVKNPATRRITKNKWRGWDITRYYYCVDIDYVFGTRLKSLIK